MWTRSATAVTGTISPARRQSRRAFATRRASLREHSLFRLPQRSTRPRASLPRAAPVQLLPRASRLWPIDLVANAKTRRSLGPPMRGEVLTVDFEPDARALALSARPDVRDELVDAVHNDRFGSHRRLVRMRKTVCAAFTASATHASTKTNTSINTAARPGSAPQGARCDLRARRCARGVARRNRRARRRLGFVGDGARTDASPARRAGARTTSAQRSAQPRVDTTYCLRLLRTAQCARRRSQRSSG